MFHLSQSSLSHIEGVDPRLVQVCKRAIEITLVDYGYPDGGGVRTLNYQREKFAQGVSKADGIVHLSNHQLWPGEKYGRAIDFYAYVDGKASWEPEHLAMVAAAHLQAASEYGYAVEWGGLWKGSQEIYGWDMCHIQLKKGT